MGISELILIFVIEVILLVGFTVIIDVMKNDAKFDEERRRKKRVLEDRTDRRKDKGKVR